MSYVKLNEDQQKMFNAITQKDQDLKIFLLRGYAGTGKTVTLSHIISDSHFKNILVIAPTVKALSVLRGKLPKKVPGKTIDFSTMSKLIETPSEKITVFEQEFKLNQTDLFGSNGLKDMLQKLQVWDDDIITQRTIYKKAGEKNEIKYIINEDLLDKNIKSKFGQSMSTPVEPDFIFKDIDEVVRVLMNYDIIMIDEMSMINEDSISQISQAMKQVSSLKLLMSGDKGQLPPVNGQLNHFFDLENPGDEVFKVDLEKILRSTDNIALVAQMIRQGVEIEQLAMTIENGSIVNVDAETFCRQNQDLLRSIDIALAFTNKDVNTFNSEIRKAKGFSGKGANVGEPVIVLENSVPNEDGLVPFANGEEFLITNKYSQKDALERVKEAFKSIGSDATIRSLKEEIEVYVEAGVVELIELQDALNQTHFAFIPIDFEKQYGYNWKNMKEAFKNFAHLNDGELPLLHVTYSYARTIHKSQGSEWTNVLLWLTSKNMWAMGKDNVKNKRSLPYTGYTRARETCHLVYSKN